MSIKPRIAEKLWYSSLKPVLLRILYAEKQGAARVLRSAIPFFERIIPPLGRGMREWHWIWQPTFSANYLEKFYEQSTDPFKFDTNPYESEKYEYTMSLLVHRTHRNALEIGASEGAFTQFLSCICDKVLAMEISSLAVERARERLRDFANVTVVQAPLPNQMPEGLFDLIVASDVLYYLSKDVLL